MPFNKAAAKSLADNAKARLDDVHAAVAALPSSPEKEILIPLVDRLHAVANGGAIKLAAHFGESPAYFSGGTDKPHED